MSFYSSNNSKFRVYKKSRRLEQLYTEDQQDGVDDILAEKRGEIDMATRYGRLAKGVINAFGQQIQSNNTQGTATSYLNQLIQNGQLSQVFDKIKTIDLDGLSDEAKNIVKDIKNPEIRKSIVSDFNSKLERIMVNNATKDEKYNMAEKKAAESQALLNASKNPSLPEMAAARARALAETRDVQALDLVKGRKPKESAFLAELKAKQKQILEKPPAEAIKDAFVESVAKGKEEALDEILDKAPVSPTATEFTMGMTEDQEDEEKEDIPQEYTETKTTDMIEEIKSLNARFNYFNKDQMKRLEAYYEKPQGNIKGGLSKKSFVEGELKKIREHSKTTKNPSVRADAPVFVPTATK